MLRIQIQESDEAIEVALAGRLVGPWVDELDQAWKKTSPNAAGKKLSLDLRDLTYSDSDGLQVLKSIFNETKAELQTSSFWSQYLADEIRNSSGTHEGKGRANHGNHA